MFYFLNLQLNFICRESKSGIICTFTLSLGKNTGMKKLLAFPLVLVLFMACNSANNQHPSAQYEEKKTSLKDMESGSPLKFLKINGDFRNNLVNQTVVEGEIKNNATLVSYKNLQLQFIFHDKEGSVIQKEKQVLDEVVKPNSSTSYKVKLSHVKDASTVTVDIVGAEAD